LFLIPVYSVIQGTTAGLELLSSTENRNQKAAIAVIEVNHKDIKYAFLFITKTSKK
jgi:hypothetical protein